MSDNLYTPYYKLVVLSEFSIQITNMLGVTLECANDMFIADLETAQRVNNVRLRLNDMCDKNAYSAFCVSARAENLAGLSLGEFLELPATVKPVGLLRFTILGSRLDQYREAEMIFMFDSPEEAMKFRLHYC